MKDLASIKQSLQGDKQFRDFQRPDECINTALAQLWSDEEVTKAFVCRISHDKRYLLLFTDKQRAIQCDEKEGVKSGFLLDWKTYEFPISTHNLSYLEPNKVRCIELEPKSWLSSGMYRVELDGLGVPVFFTMDNKDKVFAIRDTFVEIATAAQAPAKEKDEPVSAAADTPAATAQGLAAAIAEIRKMHEDGLIDKAEMLDLIKALK